MEEEPVGIIQEAISSSGLEQTQWPVTVMIGFWKLPQTPHNLFLSWTDGTTSMICPLVLTSSRRNLGALTTTTWSGVMRTSTMTVRSSMSLTMTTLPTGIRIGVPLTRTVGRVGAGTTLIKFFFRMISVFQVPCLMCWALIANLWKAEQSAATITGATTVAGMSKVLPLNLIKCSPWIMQDLAERTEPETTLEMGILAAEIGKKRLNG